jgi:Ca2+-dependent lipid-binding protein
MLLPARVLMKVDPQFGPKYLALSTNLVCGFIIAYFKFYWSNLFFSTPNDTCIW